MNNTIDPEVWLVLVKIILAHVISDFLLQPDAWVLAKHKEKALSWQLWAHAFIAGIISVLFIGFNYLYIGVFIAVFHWIIDFAKVLFDKHRLVHWFIIDQLLHVFFLVILWISYFVVWECPLNGEFAFFSTITFWVTLLLGFLCTLPAAKLIGLATERWRHSLELAGNSLTNAGMWIGMLERLLIFVFVLANEYAVIGFLIASKSILRFERKKKQSALKYTEYVLVGTLMSYTFAIFAALACRWLVF